MSHLFLNGRAVGIPDKWFLTVCAFRHFCGLSVIRSLAEQSRPLCRVGPTAYDKDPPSTKTSVPGAIVQVQPVHHNSKTRKAPRRSALLAGFVMTGAWPKASTKRGFATKQAARQPLKRAKARPMSE